MMVRKQDLTGEMNIRILSRQTAIWIWLSILAAVLAIIGSVIALINPQIYAELTPAFLPQALAQDVANLAVASPALLILSGLALHGSLRAYLLWLGVVTFTIYNYVIYTFSVPFGSLFLLWVAVLGLCLFALIGGVASVNHRAVQDSYLNRRVVVVVAWILILAAILFAFLWLSEDVPALLNGSKPPSVVELGVPTNPVHILDLSFFLPAVVLTGVWLLKQKPLAYTIAPAFLVFLILTGIPILLTPVMQVARNQAANWGAAVPIGVLTIIFLLLTAWLISTIRTT